jgi:antitoxin HicB
MAKPTTDREAPRLIEYSYTVIFELAEEGGYLVHVPALGFTTQGETLEEARVMAAEAIHGVLESRRVHGETIPDDVELTLAPHVERISVDLLV